MSPALDFLVRLGGLSAVVAALWVASWVWVFLRHPRFDRFYATASAIADVVAGCVAALLRAAWAILVALVTLAAITVALNVVPAPPWRCDVTVTERVGGTTYTYCGD